MDKDKELIRFFEKRLAQYNQRTDKDLWLQGDLEMLIALKIYIDEATFHHLKSKLENAK